MGERPREWFGTHRINVKFRDGLGDTKKDEVAHRHGLKMVRGGGLAGVSTYQVRGMDDTLEVASAVDGEGAVEYAVPDWLFNFTLYSNGVQSQYRPDISLFNAEFNKIAKEIEKYPSDNPDSQASTPLDYFAARFSSFIQQHDPNMLAVMFYILSEPDVQASLQAYSSYLLEYGQWADLSETGGDAHVKAVGKALHKVAMTGLVFSHDGAVNQQFQTDLGQIIESMGGLQAIQSLVALLFPGVPIDPYLEGKRAALSAQWDKEKIECFHRNNSAIGAWDLV